MKKRTAIALISLAAVTVYATGVSYDLISPAGAFKTVRLSRAGKAYKVSGIGVSTTTKAAIINSKVVTQGNCIDRGMILSNVEMNSYNISADNIEVALTYPLK